MVAVVAQELAWHYYFYFVVPPLPLGRNMEGPDDHEKKERKGVHIQHMLNHEKANLTRPVWMSPKCLIHPLQVLGVCSLGSWE